PARRQRASLHFHATVVRRSTRWLTRRRPQGRATPWIHRITGSCMAGASTISMGTTGRLSGWIRKGCRPDEHGPIHGREAWSEEQCMDPLALLGISIAFSFAAWGVVTVRYLWPRLRSLPRKQAFAPLLTLHAFRFIGLGFLMPGVVGPN